MNQQCFRSFRPVLQVYPTHVSCTELVTACMYSYAYSLHVTLPYYMYVSIIMQNECHVTCMKCTCIHIIPVICMHVSLQVHGIYTNLVKDGWSLAPISLNFYIGHLEVVQLLYYSMSETCIYNM